MGKMTDIKLLVLDIDGTIAGQSNQISDTVRQAIIDIQKKDINVALATGRMYCSAKRFHQAINSTLPIIAYNGAWIQNPLDNKILSHIPLPKNIAARLLDYYQQPQWGNEIEIHFYFNDQLYVQGITDHTKSYFLRSIIQPTLVDNLHYLLENDPTKVLGVCYNLELSAKIRQNLRETFTPEEVFLTQSSPVYLEATHPIVNKGFGVKYLAEKILNLKPENVMTIGDNFNDLAMLQYAGLSVAMGDAPQEVKNEADWVTDTVENEGVALAIAKFLS